MSRHNYHVTNSDVLQFLLEFTAKHRYAPSYRQIAEAFNLSSTATIKRRLDDLQAQGKIVKEAGLPRTIRILI